MSNVIDFLEQVGRDPVLRHASGLEMEAALTQAGIEAPLRAAIVGGDTRLLEDLMGATPTICCLVHVPGEEEGEEKEDEVREDEEEIREDEGEDEDEEEEKKK
jgi:hypothetical protein